MSADVSLSSSLRVKALSCIALLIRLKSKVPLHDQLCTETRIISVRNCCIVRHKRFLFFKAVLKQKLLAPILQVVFPILSATPPSGEEDPEDEENAEGDNDSQSPKHFAAQVSLTPFNTCF